MDVDPGPVVRDKKRFEVKKVRGCMRKSLPGLDFICILCSVVECCGTLGMGYVFALS